jgi:hypothetical protein
VREIERGTFEQYPQAKFDMLRACDRKLQIYAWRAEREWKERYESDYDIEITCEEMRNAAEYVDRDIAVPGRE